MTGGTAAPAVVDRLLFGDNQFFGINHMSEERARAQEMRFQDLSAIMAVLDVAYDEGITTFMCTTHDRVAEIVERVRAEPKRYRNFQFHPCMPYAHKYADAVTELGMLGALRRFLPDEGLIDTTLRGGRAVATKNVEGLIKLLVDAEMTMFRSVATPVIWLQNVIVDLLVGLEFTDALSIYADHVRARYHAEPGFITMNLPQLLDALDDAGVDNPLVCASINKIGFRMSGGIDSYRSVLSSHRCRVVAMSVLASGAIPAEEAIRWVATMPNVHSIVFGASSAGNIRATKALVDQYLGAHERPAAGVAPKR